MMYLSRRTATLRSCDVLRIENRGTCGPSLGLSKHYVQVELTGEADEFSAVGWEARQQAVEVCFDPRIGALAWLQAALGVVQPAPFRHPAVVVHFQFLGCGGSRGEDAGQRQRQVVTLKQAQVHALDTCGHGDMGSVTGQPHPAAAKTSCLAAFKADHGAPRELSYTAAEPRSAFRQQLPEMGLLEQRLAAGAGLNAAIFRALGGEVAETGGEEIVFQGFGVVVGVTR